MLPILGKHAGTKQHTGCWLLGKYTGRWWHIRCCLKTEIRKQNQITNLLHHQYMEGYTHL
jgi:hypothetical protein